MSAPNRYRLDCAFHGARFHGWQRQPALRTVQGELEEWLAKLLGAQTPISVTGAGRTDAGVHARGMVAHFDWPEKIDAPDLLHRLTSALPDDLIVNDLRPIDPGFHARYSALQKTYEYRVSNQPSPFERDRTWFIHGDVRWDELSDAANAILGENDFAGFCIAESLKPNTVCRVHAARWHTDGTVWRFRITADRFLHQMVRLLVGTQIDIARGRWPVDRMHEILDARDVRLCGQAAPAHGLTLISVEYP